MGTVLYNDRRFWLAGFLAVLLVHFFWQTLNTMPAVWDMAHHQKMGWLYLASLKEGDLLAGFATLSTFYPPLYYLQESLFLGLLGETQYLPLLSNLVGLGLLSYCTFRFGAHFLGGLGAVLSGVLVLLFPLVAWTSRESLLDVPLAGWVMAALFLLLKSDHLRSGPLALLFGLVVAAGMLTKWTFVFFLGLPVIQVLIASPSRRETLKNLANAAILATPLIFWWYLPNLDFLLGERFSVTVQEHALRQDPGLWSFQNWLYYPRSLLSYYLFLPLSVFFLAGLWRWLRCRKVLFAQKLIWGSLLGGLLAMGTLYIKDPRYIMPLAGPLALLLATFYNDRPGWLQLATALAFVQFLAVSFSLPGLSGKLAVGDQYPDPDYLNISREWVLYESSYFGVGGPPRRQDWQHQTLAGMIPAGARVGFLPDLAFFHPGALELVYLSRGERVQVARLGLKPGSVGRLGELDFVVGKTGEQGITYLTQHNQDVYEALENLKWPLAGQWVLPDQSQARLWRNPTLSR